MKSDKKIYKITFSKKIPVEISRVFKTSNIIRGKFSTKFENELKKKIGNRKLITTNEFSKSVELVLKSMDIKPGDEILTTPLACLATNMPILNCSAIPVWYDINPKNGNPDLNHLKKKVSKKTKAIFIYHWCGNPIDLNSIYKFANKYSLKVVEDASESFGSKYKNKYIGNTGSDYSIFSFHPSKSFNSINGAAITTKKLSDFKKINKMRRYGINDKTFRLSNDEINPRSNIYHAGYNLQLDNISSIVGYFNLLEVFKKLKKQNKNEKFYNSNLNGLKKITLFGKNKHAKSNNFLYMIIVDDSKKFIKYLNNHKIQCTRLHLRNDIYSCFKKYSSSSKELVGVKKFSSTVVSIPIGWWLTSDDLNYIVNIIKSY
jgi:dTDP-4-amino-4,6-dideoxygalactose transaminase